MHFTHCVVRIRLGDNPKREDTSRSLILLRELLHVVDIMLTIPLRVFSGILIVRFLVLIRIPSCVRMP